MKIIVVLCLFKFLEACTIKNIIDIKSQDFKIHSFQQKQTYVLEINYGFEVESNLDRKRSHKRRRKIRKPVKGLR